MLLASEGVPKPVDFERGGAGAHAPRINGRYRIFGLRTRHKANRAEGSSPARSWESETQIQTQPKNDPLPISAHALPSPLQLFPSLGYLEAAAVRRAFPSRHPASRRGH